MFLRYIFKILMLVITCYSQYGIFSAMAEEVEPSYLENLNSEAKSVFANAVQGDAEAQFQFGIIAAATENFSDAAIWLKKSAEQGNPQA